MKKSTLFAVLFSAMFFFGFHQVGWGQLLTEDFNYTSGDLLTAHGWTAHSGAGTNSIAISPSSISFAGYLSSGIGQEVSLVATGEDVNKTFTAQTSGNIYASFLVNVSSSSTTGDYFFHFGATTISTNFRGRLFVKKDASNNIAFGISQSTTTANLTPYIYSLNTTYLIVVRYTIVSGTTNDISAIYVNPPLYSAEPASGWITNTDASGTDLADVGSIALRQCTTANATGLKLDGIRVSTTQPHLMALLTPEAALQPIKLLRFQVLILPMISPSPLLPIMKYQPLQGVHS